LSSSIKQIEIGDGVVERKISREMKERIVKDFLDIAIMAKLMDGNPLSGYDVLAFVHNKFGVLLSSGTVYSVIYSMERNGLVSGMWNKRKRVYKLTDKGEKNIKTVLNLIGEIQNTVKLLIGSELRTSRSPSP
jgi:DNA-binding PadR family transcriptional regulator